MNLIIDSREHKLIEIFEQNQIPFHQEQLEIGDIHIKNMNTNEILLVIERKTLCDLYSSIQDGRHREQKARLLAHYAPQQVCYLLEGTMKMVDYRKKIICGAQLNTLFRDKLTIMYSNDPKDSVVMLVALLQKCEKNPEWFRIQTHTNSENDTNNANANANNYVNTIKLKKTILHPVFVSYYI